MSKVRGLFLAGAAVILLAGCQPVASPVSGLLILDVKAPLDAGERVGSKEGKACAQSILGLVGQGDASIKAAANAGGITKIDSVDFHSTSTLGVIAEFCTIVRGS